MNIASNQTQSPSMIFEAWLDDLLLAAGAKDRAEPVTIRAKAWLDEIDSIDSLERR